jgi:AraC-like DNA-binding protein
MSDSRALQPLVDGPPCPASPERRLMIAVLEDAIACFEKYYLPPPRHGNRLFREAEEWIMNDHYHAPFSFEHICSVLGLEPTAVRRQLREAVAERRSAVA